MNFRITLTLVLATVICSSAIAQEGFELKAAEITGFSAESGPVKSVILGATDPNTEDPQSGFKFQLELSSKGAAIRKATFSNGFGNGFDDRDHENPQPLVLLRPVTGADGDEILSMANKELVFVKEKLLLRLNRLHWKSNGVQEASDGSQTAAFELIIKAKKTGEPVLKLTKTYKVVPGSYLLECGLVAENVGASEQQVQFNLTGPLGLGLEGVRSDMRYAVAGFMNPAGQVISARVGARKLYKAGGSKDIFNKATVKAGVNFLWTAAVNKYFAAVVVPIAGEGKDYCDWLTSRKGHFYNPDGDPKANSGDETIGVDLKIAEVKLQANSAKTYNFRIYIGPKDKRLFDKDEYYKKMGFVHTITFMPCFCCPTSIIHPLAFGILAIMEWMHSFIPNYGVVIIIFVFIIRLCLHPLTKKSQVSMSKFGKIAPKAAAIKKQYADNKAEMNKQMMGLYKKHGASPVMGMLPMFVQMPIWISLYSAIYASIALRGAAFLPFWITDLSAPDALVRFSTITIPLLGTKIDSFNLLPILMGFAFFLQQKLMPKQPAANPQAEQQQKMMMFMMPLLFPLMLYKAPSGLNLYIMASTFAGVIEQYFIRKHIREAEEAESKGLVAVTSKTGGKVKKKKPKPFYKT